MPESATRRLGRARRVSIARRPLRIVAWSGNAPPTLDHSTRCIDVGLAVEHAKMADVPCVVVKFSGETVALRISTQKEKNGKTWSEARVIWKPAKLNEADTRAEGAFFPINPFPIAWWLWKPMRLGPLWLVIFWYLWISLNNCACSCFFKSTGTKR